MSFSSNSVRLLIEKSTFVCPDIDCYIATLWPRQLGNGMDYYRGRSSMSGYGLGNWFSKLFHSPLPLAKKYTDPVAVDFSSSTLYYWDPPKDFKESISQNLRFSVRCLGERLKSRQNGNGLKRARNTLSFTSHEKRKTSLLTKNKKKPRVKIVQSKKFFS